MFHVQCTETNWIHFLSATTRFLSHLGHNRKSLIVCFFLLRPFWLMILLAVLIQHITARFCFIKKTAGTQDLNNRWFTSCLHFTYIYQWLSAGFNSLTHRAGVICSCWRTCCSLSMFWSVFFWLCGAWSSQLCSTSSTWDAWILVFLTATWRHSTQVSHWWSCSQYLNWDRVETEGVQGRAKTNFRKKTWKLVP